MFLLHVFVLKATYVVESLLDNFNELNAMLVGHTTKIKVVFW
jgi:hypothetical protein